MKKCDDCQCDMIENCQIGGRHPFDVDVKQRVDITVSIPTGQKTSFLGIPCETSNRYGLKARVCPRCGKVELYADFGRER